MRKKHLHRRRTSLKRVVLSLLVMILVAIVGIGGVALWGLQAVQAPGPLEEPTNVVIEHGQPTAKIGAVLEENGVVSDQRLFVLTSYLTRSTGGVLKAGEYEFPARASLVDVLAIIRSGRSVVHKVTVPEGWTSAQVVERVDAHPALTGTISEVPEEGSLLPDTYVFQRGTEREVLLARMRDAQTALLDELWEDRAPDLPFETREEALVLASIVEKETAVAEERQQVAAVFVNRMRRNMRLQSDPTIIYGITNGERHLDRPIRRSDISAETPYNTYRIDGLPPTPIANPGREAIAAVLQPDSSDHLYFVADGTGGHAFARTLDEHNANVQRWREIEQAAPDEPEPEPEAPEADDTDTEVPSDASTSAPAAPTPGEDKADDLIAAANARDEAVEPAPSAEAAETEAEPEPSAEAAETEAEPEPEPSETLAERDIPLPRSKPPRD